MAFLVSGMSWKSAIKSQPSTTQPKLLHLSKAECRRRFFGVDFTNMQHLNGSSQTKPKLLSKAENWGRFEGVDITLNICICGNWNGSSLIPLQPERVRGYWTIEHEAPHKCLPEWQICPPDTGPSLRPVMQFNFTCEWLVNTKDILPHLICTHTHLNVWAWASVRCSSIWNACFSVGCEVWVTRPVSQRHKDQSQKDWKALN